MTPFLARPLFEVQQEQFTWADAVLLAHLRGAWEPVLGGIAEDMVRLREYEAAEAEDLEDAVDAAAAEFRYDRELLSADATEAWLTARGVTSTEWLDSIRRQLLRRGGMTVDGANKSSGLSSGALEVALPGELACTPLGRELAEHAAGQVAAAAALGESFADGATEPVPSTAPMPPGLDLPHLRKRRALLERIGVASAQFVARSLSAAAVEREIRLHQMDWVRLECLMVRFDDPAQAREAALCLREDQQAMAVVAASSHRTPVPTALYIEEIEESLRPVFLSAVVGDTIGPVQLGEDHLLYQVAAKTMPVVGNRDLQQRATARLSAKALAGESQRRVRWLISW